MCNNETMLRTKYTVKEPFFEKRVVDLLVIMGRQHYEVDNELLYKFRKCSRMKLLSMKLF